MNWENINNTVEQSLFDHNNKAHNDKAHQLNMSLLIFLMNEESPGIAEKHHRLYMQVLIKTKYAKMHWNQYRTITYARHPIEE